MSPQISLTADVVQNATFISSSAMSNISVTCEHDDSSKYRKSWYRQEKSKGLLLIGYTDSTSEAMMESEFNDGKMKIQPVSSQKSILTIMNVSAKDNAVYYCASSIHSEILL
ncbi:hypothetical protein GDO78_014558 [Eleutherodactylus coqui]|uniref:Ig-like domain-containing protein n=1 Tax=Eleutherodactylus coqui TaxID=57060 RepID=A0A8J6JXM1_ELECQ|nr:hypothetical protein GDO78_014558 [Eleutherodactylus coqui]